MIKYFKNHEDDELPPELSCQVRIQFNNPNDLQTIHLFLNQSKELHYFGTDMTNESIPPR